VQNVVFLRVVEPIRMPSGETSIYFSGEDVKRANSESKVAAENYLSQLANRTKYDGVNVQTEVLTGKAAESIAEYVGKNGVDLITIATHGRSGVSRWVWGSVADRVLRSVGVPALIVRPQGCAPGI
jgi:nucleotide-binding universal stress UspA family protein